MRSPRRTVPRDDAGLCRALCSIPACRAWARGRVVWPGDLRRAARCVGRARVGSDRSPRRCAPRDDDASRSPRHGEAPSGPRPSPDATAEGCVAPRRGCPHCGMSRDDEPSFPVGVYAGWDADPSRVPQAPSRGCRASERGRVVWPGDLRRVARCVGRWRRASRGR